MIDMARIQFGILADTFHAPVKGELAFIPDFLILVDLRGDIVATFHSDDVNYGVHLNALCESLTLITVEKGQYLMPGLVDLHCHAPQWPQAGKGLDLPLYDWLQNYTFPLENRYSDLAFADTVYQDVTRTLLANGTTSAVYFASIHREASELLASISLEQGQRAFVGRINMDNAEQCPAFYRESSVEQSLADTEAFIHNVRGLKGNEHGLVKPVITPRFVPSCTETLLRELGKLVQHHDVHMQTHCSESDWARDYALQHYGKSDIEIYADAGLLNNKTVLAHSIFLTDNDVAVMKEFDAGIGHCPLSNMYFANAAMHTRELLDSGVSIGLGSDIAGAPSPSIFRASFDAVTHSRVREDGVDSRLVAAERGVTGSRVSFVEAFWMATAGGGRVLNEKVGVFEKDFHFDALVIKPSALGNLRIWQDMDTPRDILEKIVSLGQRCDIDKVWVQGKQVR
ncbi:guanine deaminase [Enterovibrio norvegicus FF-162]|uniref:amidohydrolase family protein n=1 Tax=Enterovibrio norvegicus TaxID=188144 RepID=UPI0003137287|nr:amidohydrolase family protein [Enterovibrio norvegicus]OEE87064.1 guanine deaminase [Enterovibrio norvegicus FF-162]